MEIESPPPQGKTLSKPPPFKKPRPMVLLDEQEEIEEISETQLVDSQEEDAQDTEQSLLLKETKKVEEQLEKKDKLSLRKFAPKS
jgi:hypothetical protein